MTRSAATSILAAVALAGALGGCVRGDEIEGLRKPGPPITADITCTGGNVKVGLFAGNPPEQAWTFKLKKNEELVWTLGRQIEAFKLEAKPNSDFPLVPSAPTDSVKDKWKVDPNYNVLLPKTIHYRIIATCRVDSTRTITIEIDPDMIITLT